MPRSGQCTIARTPVDEETTPADLANRTLWRYWNGTNWTACTNSCSDTELQSALLTQRALRLPTPEVLARAPDDTRPCRDGTPAPALCPAPAYVPQHFQVAFDDHLGAFVSAHQRIAILDNQLTVRIRVAADPTGPWSKPVDVLVDCDQRESPARGNLMNCYQLGPHPELAGPSPEDVVFHYYDHFAGTFEPPPAPPNAETVDEALRFLSVPLCVKDKSLDTGEGPSVDVVVGFCWMTDDGWTGSDMVDRKEAAAILWRLGWFRDHEVDTTFTDVPGPYQEAVGYFVDPPPGRDFTDVWPAASGSSTQFHPDTVALRGETIRLLWKSAGSPTAGSGGSYPNPSPTDWLSTLGDSQLRAALRWAYAEGVTCSTTFNAEGDTERRVLAKWITRSMRGPACTGSE